MILELHSLKYILSEHFCLVRNTQLLDQMNSLTGFEGIIPINYSNHLAPVVTNIFNSSLQLQVVPHLWKSANVLLIPKEFPLEVCKQLRPISLTNIMRIFEKLVLKQELSLVTGSVISKDQHTYKEKHHTTMALVKCYHSWVKWLDKDADFARVFSFDFSKAFDTVNAS